MPHPICNPQPEGRLRETQNGKVKRSAPLSMQPVKSTAPTTLTTRHSAGAPTRMLSGHVVPLRAAPGAPPEWTLIELQVVLRALSCRRLPARALTSICGQGTLEATGSMAGLDLGALRMEGKDAVLRIGSHELAGKMVALPKPLAVTQRAVTGGAIEVVGVVRSKVVFKTRPTTVTTTQ